MTPRSDSRQNVILNRVETVPATRSYRYVDYWGTAVTAFDLHAPHTELEVTSSSVVETDSRRDARGRGHLGGPGLGGGDRPVRRDAHPNALHPSEQADPAGGQAHRQVQRPVRCRSSPPPEWAHSELEYVPGTTGVHSSGLDAHREGKGVCQDFAHLTLILLRGMGIPARYVSGYLHPNQEGGGR